MYNVLVAYWTYRAVSGPYPTCLCFCPWSRCEKGRQSVYLPSHDPRAGLYHAGLCQDRCCSLHCGKWYKTSGTVLQFFVCLFFVFQKWDTSKHQHGVLRVRFKSHKATDQLRFVSCSVMYCQRVGSIDSVNMLVSCNFCSDPISQRKHQLNPSSLFW